MSKDGQQSSSHRLVVVMGVSGSGKSTLGRALADALGAPFAEGDDFHPEENRRKMADGRPLTDRDRGPWLDRLCGHLDGADAPIVVLACSALTPFVRERLSGLLRWRISWVLLDVPKEELRRRMLARDHFMPVSLLESQLAALTIPEGAMVLAPESVSRMVTRVREALPV